MRISDWSSDVCSSDLTGGGTRRFAGGTLSHAPAAKQKPRRPAVRGRTCTIALALRRLFYLGERTFFRKWPGRRAGLPLGANVPRQRPSADASSFISPPGAVPPASNLHRGSDRKSVVSGKSVSVRVDLGGRRSIKKK